MTLTPVAERLAVELILPDFCNLSLCVWDSNTQSSACEAYALIDCAMAAAAKYEKLRIKISRMILNLMK